MIYPWQTALWQQRSFPQALLLEGPEGLGKVAFAYALAQLRLCQSPGEEACGQCQSCHWFLQNNHPDFYCVTPEADSRFIKIEQIRALTDKLSRTSHSAYQVALIYPMEAMNTAASNALLKTLEEPQPGASLFLVTHRKAQLPATIISRCQSLRFSANFSQEAVHFVQTATKLTLENAHLMLLLAQGAPCKAVALAQENFLTIRNQAIQDIQDLLNHQTAVWSRVAGSSKNHLALLLQALYLVIHDVIKLQLKIPAHFLSNTDQQTALIHIANQWGSAQAQNALQKVIEAQQYFQGFVHVNPELLLENVYLQFNPKRE